MARAREDESNNSPKTASGNHVISDYGGSTGRWYFDASVQGTGAEYSPIDPYDPVDYFSFRHLAGLEKVSWNMSFLMGNLWNFEEPAKDFGGIYNLNINPSGAFKGQAVSVLVKTGYANYVDEWYGYNEAWRQVEGMLDMKWQLLHGGGRDTTSVDRALDLMDDLQSLLAQIPGADSAELDVIEDGLEDILAVSPATYDDAASIRAMVNDVKSMAAGWDRLHYYLGNSEEEVFLKDMSDRVTWKVKGDGPGYVAFSGGVTIYNSFYDFDFAEAFVSTNWYLEVQSESRPRASSAAAAVPVSDAPHPLGDFWDLAI